MAAKKASLKQNIENAVQLTWTNATGSSVSVGDPVAIATTSGHRIAGVVLANKSDPGDSTVENGEIASVAIKGRFLIAKVATVQTFAQGSTVWWDASEEQADDATTCNTMSDFVLGMCTKAAAATDTYVEVDLNEGLQWGSIGSSSSSG